LPPACRPPHRPGSRHRCRSPRPIPRSCPVWNVQNSSNIVLASCFLLLLLTTFAPAKL
jgi:hypothetical protein